MRIELSEETAKTLLKMDERYYFGLFKEIIANEEEEFEMRNALIDIAKEIKEQEESVYEKRGLRTL